MKTCSQCLRFKICDEHNCCASCKRLEIEAEKRGDYSPSDLAFSGLADGDAF